MKAVCSFSGGLDSILAARITAEEGIEVEGIYFKTGFGGCGDEESTISVQKRAAEVGIGLTIMDVSEDLIRIINSPKFGYGRNMNPCMDCHAIFFSKCAEHMQRTGASFIVTGEVVGERPMSQRKRAMLEIDRFTGLGGLILRPLSAKLLEETLPERKGWIQRDRLFGISGRSRRPQRLLAEKFGIKSYPNAAGGCLLTEKNFSKKLKDLIEHKNEITPRDIKALRSGRHFRLPEGGKLVLGRNEKENLMLLERVSEEEINFMTVDVPGPVGLLSGEIKEGDESFAAGVIAAYSDISAEEEIVLRKREGPCDKWHKFTVTAPSKREVREFLV